jgi:regulator of sirC expression with transglutaminase-like and TPR domain
MNFKLEIPSHLSYFGTLVQSDEHLPLLEAAVSLAQDEYPELDTQHTLGEVDHLLARLKRRLPADASTLHRLRVLNHLFFDELGFRGNVNNYYDPDNSFITQVLKTRQGIPISLAVLWLEVATGIGLNASGVNFPGHFLIKVQLNFPNEGQVIIDPFTGGSLSKEDLLEMLSGMPGLPTHSSPLLEGSPSIADLDSRNQHPNFRQSADTILRHYLKSASEREILQRMLSNLLDIYRTQNDPVRAQQVQKRIDILNSAH